MAAERVCLQYGKRGESRKWDTGVVCVPRENARGHSASVRMLRGRVSTHPANEHEPRGALLLSLFQNPILHDDRATCSAVLCSVRCIICFVDGVDGDGGGVILASVSGNTI